MRRDAFHIVQVMAHDRSLALVPGEPRQNVHLAFLVAGKDTIGEFHRVALAAGAAGVIGGGGIG